MFRIFLGVILSFSLQAQVKTTCYHNKDYKNVSVSKNFYDLCKTKLNFGDSCICAYDAGQSMHPAPLACINTFATLSSIQDCLDLQTNY